MSLTNISQFNVRLNEFCAFYAKYVAQSSRGGCRDKEILFKIYLYVEIKYYRSNSESNVQWSYHCILYT